MDQSQKLVDKLVKMEKELAHLRLIQEATSDGIWDWDVRTNQSKFSHRYYTMLGYEPDEFPATYDAWRELVHPEDLDRTETIIRTYLMDNAKEYHVEFRMKQKDGSYKWLLARGKAVEWDEMGNPIRMVGTHVDIDNTKKNEEKLHRAEKIRMLGIMAGSIAHDFNNMLTGILTEADYILYTLSENDPLREELSIIKDAAEQISNLVNDLSILGIPQIKKPREFNVSEELNRVLKSVSHKRLVNLYPSITLETNFDKSCVILGSNTHYFNAMLHLIKNAYEAVNEEHPEKDGHIKIEIMRHFNENPSDSIPIGEYCKIIFSDNGIGIEKENISRVFEPFYTTKSTTSGMGLGLYVVSNVIEELNGNIQIESEIHAGTKVILYFPLKTYSELEPSTLPEQLNIHIGKKEKILIVDDLGHQRTIAKKLLKKLNYEVEVAENGRIAVEKTKNKDYTCIILDMIMPEMDGLDTMLEIITFKPHQKFIINTGHSETARVQAALQKGALLLRKPYKFADLSEILHAVINN